QFVAAAETKQPRAWGDLLIRGLLDDAKSHESIVELHSLARSSHAATRKAAAQTLGKLGYGLLVPGKDETITWAEHLKRRRYAQAMSRLSAEDVAAAFAADSAHERWMAVHTARLRKL